MKIRGLNLPNPQGPAQACRRKTCTYLYAIQYSYAHVLAVSTNWYETTRLKSLLSPPRPLQLLLRTSLSAQSCYLNKWRWLLSWFMAWQSPSLIQCISYSEVSLYLYCWYFISAWNKIGILHSKWFPMCVASYGSNLITNIEFLHHHPIKCQQKRCNVRRGTPGSARCTVVRHRTTCFYLQHSMECAQCSQTISTVALCRTILFVFRTYTQFDWHTDTNRAQTHKN
jgi:hypothetical protein